MFWRDVFAKQFFHVADLVVKKIEFVGERLNF